MLLLNDNCKAQMSEALWGRLKPWFKDRGGAREEGG